MVLRLEGITEDVTISFVKIEPKLLGQFGTVIVPVPSIWAVAAFFFSKPSFGVVAKRKMRPDIRVSLT